MTIPEIFNQKLFYKIEVVCMVGNLKLTKSECDGYPCIFVWDDSGSSYFPARPVFLRIENDIVLWGAFDGILETITIEVEGKTYTREQRKKVVWYPLNLPEDFLTSTLMPAMQLVLEQRI